MGSVSTFSDMGGAVPSKVVVEGTVEPGYEPVRDTFTHNCQHGSEEHSQLCAYVDGKKVVDLWCRVNDQSTFNGDSFTNVYSNTKTVTAVVMAMAKDRGWLDYADKISKHWPEFGQKGKENITIADLLRHEAGMAEFKEPLELTDTLRESIKKNWVGDKLASMCPTWPTHGKREYHSLTQGYLANEIFRRIHPDKLTIGEFIDKELADKLNADIYIGCSKENFFVSEEVSFAWRATQGLKETMGLKTAQKLGIVEMAQNTVSTLAFLRDLKPDIRHTTLHDVNTEELRRAEMPSSNANCSARGLAVLGSAMANRGVHNGVRILGEPAWRAMHADPVDGHVLEAEVPFTQGGLARFPDKGYRRGYYGWYGFGGSMFTWSPELNIAFAYTCTLLLPFSNRKANMMQALVSKCAAQLRTKQSYEAGKSFSGFGSGSGSRSAPMELPA